MNSKSDIDRSWVIALINDYCSSEKNNLNNGTTEPSWAAPLVGFANGADAIFQQYKLVVGTFHWTPTEAMQQSYSDTMFEPEELTIISWILPQTPITKSDNRNQDTYPAERWARSRIFGEQFNHALRQHVEESLINAGYPTVAPMELSSWSIKDSEEYVYASTWSERHAAYAAGLGTFGLCDGLITPKGKAMRTGSVVSNIKLKADVRPYKQHQAYCLFYSHGICGKCISRCPANALSINGHDKVKCSAHLKVTRSYVRENYGFEGYGCGLCQTGVPCESRIPNIQDG